jgi:hypothetical protein
MGRFGTLCVLSRRPVAIAVPKVRSALVIPPDYALWLIGHRLT